MTPLLMKKKGRMETSDSAVANERAKSVHHDEECASCDNAWSCPDCKRQKVHLIVVWWKKENAHRFPVLL
jgi:hypothetical protein